MAGAGVLVARLDDGREVIADTLCAEIAGLPLAEFNREVRKLPGALQAQEVEYLSPRGLPRRGRALAWLDMLAGLHADDVPGALARLWRAAVSRLEDELDADDEEDGAL